MKGSIVTKIGQIEAIVDTKDCPKSRKEEKTYAEQVGTDVQNATTEEDAYTAEQDYYKTAKLEGSTSP